MKKLLLKSMLLLSALIVGSSSVWADKVTKEETFNFSTSGCTGWSTDNAGSYCGGYGRNKAGSYYVANASISNFSSVNFSAVNTPSVTIYVKALTNGGDNEYTVSLIDKDGKVVGTPVTKTDGMGSGSNASSAKESSVILTPVSGTTGYRIDFPAKSAITQTKYTLTYDPAPAAPTFSPSAGDFSDDFELTISCATDGATIYYTTNGDTPTSSSTVYDPANKPTITAGADVTVKAIAIKAGVSSTVSSATYTYKNIANPVFGTTDGSTVLYGESVAITCATDGADIYYTQGSTPADPTSSSTKYTGPIVLTAGTTIKAIAINGSDESEVVSATYTVKATAPTFSLDEGTYNTTKSVMLSCTTDDATIYYTTDGTIPTNESTVYSSAIAVNVSTTINAIAIKSGLTNSDVTSAEYTLKVATPSFSISGGDFDEAQDVEIICTTEGATIHYTTNGAAPTSSSLEYTDVVTISDVKTLKAIAIKDGWTNSDVVSEEYRVVVPANLPFFYDGNGTGTLPTGFTVSGLGTYGTSPKMQFNSTGDWAILKFAETPGKLSYTLKGNGLSGDYKFSVLESANGTDYSVLQEYTSIDATAFTETFTPASTTRYIKWIYTTKVNGNVALGKINLDLPGPADPTTSGDVTYLTTSDNMAGWRAFYDKDNSYSVDVNTTVYVADVDPDLVENKITLKAISGIPANVPVILHTSSITDSHKMTLTKKTTEPYTYTGTNNLIWTTSAVSNKYRLGYGASGVGFYPYSGTPASGAVILNVSSASGARELTIDIDDDVTGISTMHNSQCIMNNDFYNLAGQRVAQPTKGLYIVNGKKVVVK